MYQMLGDLAAGGQVLRRAGFMPGGLGDSPFVVGPSLPVFTRGSNIQPEHVEFIAAIQRGEFTGDLSQIGVQLGTTLQELVRGVSSGQTAFPVRENLEAEAKILVPLQTPVRNMLPRSVGSGLSSAWKQATSLGGGWDTTLDQPGSPAKIRAFFSETITGSQAPAEHTTVYANKSATYKLLGTFGSITGLAMAGGANYMNQLAAEKTNAVRNLMLNEENALINGDSTSLLAPWGDGTNALAFDGFVNLITTGNGTPAAQVQSSVGALTMSHIDNQLARIWAQGGQDPYMIMSKQEIMSLVHLAEANGSIIRVDAPQGNATLGVSVKAYKHPITGEDVPILASRFLAAGTILFCSKYLPDGSPAMDVQVLPQVQLPELAPNENIQGYTAQEIAPSVAAPHVYPFCVAVYETTRMKASTVFAKSTGVTAV